MDSEPRQAPPALFSLLIFLAINYGIGYEIGHWLTGSTVGAIAIALVTPCLTLLAVALIKRPSIDTRPLDKAR